MDMRLIGEVVPAPAEQAGPWGGGRGGNDYITYMIRSVRRCRGGQLGAEVRAIAPP
ncbi:hypothetical protein ACNF49_30390 [Actinomadura sp. ATCC 39365]